MMIPARIAMRPRVRRRMAMRRGAGLAEDLQLQKTKLRPTSIPRIPPPPPPPPYKPAGSSNEAYKPPPTLSTYKPTAKTGKAPTTTKPAAKLRSNEAKTTSSWLDVGKEVGKAALPAVFSAVGTAFTASGQRAHEEKMAREAAQRDTAAREHIARLERQQREEEREVERQRRLQQEKEREELGRLVQGPSTESITQLRSRATAFARRMQSLFPAPFLDNPALAAEVERQALGIFMSEAPIGQPGARSAALAEIEFNLSQAQARQDPAGTLARTQGTQAPAPGAKAPPAPSWVSRGKGGKTTVTSILSRGPRRPRGGGLRQVVLG
jgi:hypothetical protein